jgi:hypothetical protein
VAGRLRFGAGGWRFGAGRSRVGARGWRFVAGGRRLAAWGFLAAGLVAAGAAGAAAQNVETDPLQCWWRTSAGAIRVGEPFSAVLTCAVLETDDVKVVVDESRLEPSVMQVVPFEVLGGVHAADLRTEDRRFFQYEYRLRLISENQFGKDVALPETKLSYRVQSLMWQGAGARGQGGRAETIEGRDQTYLLPPLSMRLLSLVPSDASDIRDAAAETFADLDQRAFRASLLVVVGGVLFALAALVAVLTIVRAFVRSRKPTAAADRLIGDGAILRGVGRELAAVQRQREDGGWNSELAARALAALRLIGTYAIGRKAARTLITSNGSTAATTADKGRLVVSAAWPKRKRIAVSGSVTGVTLSTALARVAREDDRAAELESMSGALTQFTTAQFGRDGTFDDAVLDESLQAGVRLLKRLKFEQTWVMKRLRRRPVAVSLEGQATWSR